MSTYYGYRCKHDGAESNQWFNHGEDKLRMVAKCWPAIKQFLQQAALHDDIGYLDMRLSGLDCCESEIWAFLSEHYEHGIEIYNENRRSFPIEEGSHDTR